MCRSSFILRHPSSLAGSKQSKKPKTGSEIILPSGYPHTGVMGDMPKTPKRPRDLNQWAKRMADIATGEDVIGKDDSPKIKLNLIHPDRRQKTEKKREARR